MGRCLIGSCSASCRWLQEYSHRRQPALQCDTTVNNVRVPVATYAGDDDAASLPGTTPGGNLSMNCAISPGRVTHRRSRCCKMCFMARRNARRRNGCPMMNG